MSNRENENGSGESSDEDLPENQRSDNNHEQSSLRCEICAKQYKSFRSWKHHIQESHIRKRKCEFCGKSYSRLGKLRLHQQKEHGKDKPERKQKLTSFKCSTCSKSFSKKYNLTRHCKCVHNHTPQKKTLFFHVGIVSATLKIMINCLPMWSKDTHYTSRKVIEQGLPRQFIIHSRKKPRLPFHVNIVSVNLKITIDC